MVELQASGLPGSTPGRAVKVQRGLGWSGGHRRQEIERRGYSPAFGPWRNSGAARVVVEDRGLEAKPGLGAELWESLAGVVAWQGDVATAVRCSAPGGGRGVGTGA